MLLLPPCCAVLPETSPSAAPPWKAGVVAVTITPRKSLWLAGYAARTKPSEGTLQELYAKALALEDGAERRSVLVTTDILGFPASLAERIGRRAREQYGLPRERLLLNSSHTHGGPVVGDTLRVAYQGMTEAQWAAVRAYTRELEDRMVACIGEALKGLRPARLSFGRGQAGFAGNRRLQLNPDGPVDHDVPVLRIDGENGSLRAVVFTYACHCTTLGAETYRFHGDYAGYAQEHLERRHPSAKAFFVTGCGGDANPAPRGTLELVRQYGESLGKAVDQAGALQGSGGNLTSVNGPLACAWDRVALPFAAPPDRAAWAAKLEDPNVYVRRHAREMLDLLELERKLPAAYPYPVQVWRFGAELTLIALAGEVVVDYALRLKQELGAERTWVAGYCNDVFAYVPSERVLREGGYEGAGAMIYYSQPGPFAPGVEERIIAKVRGMVR